MRPKTILCFAALVLSTINPCAATSLTANEVAQLKKEVESIQIRSLHPLGGSASYQSRQAFDPSVLSSKESRFVFAVARDANGDPELFPIIEKGTEADRFYCEQTIWETFPFSGMHPSEKYALCEFDLHSPVKASFPELSTPNSTKVSIHLIPAYVLRFGSTYEKLFHSTDNVVQIDKGHLNAPALSEFRKEWSEFFRKTTRLNLELLSAEAKRLKDKYNSLFQV